VREVRRPHGTHRLVLHVPGPRPGLAIDRERRSVLAATREGEAGRIARQGRRAVALALFGVHRLPQGLVGLERSSRDPAGFELLACRRAQVAIEPLAVKAAALKAG
jgi:hypothetical protein